MPYDAWLQESMRSEPVEFFREMFSKNMPIDGFVESDWTIANARLCDFYGLPEPKSGGFQRVSLKPENRRGGLLTMGAVLGLTSDGTRHRPVHRGVWLSEVVLGKPPPPPPANVPAIEPPTPQSPKATLRDKLEAHRKNANCAACHAKIDPLGLAFENYDAIGRWRTEEVTDGIGANPQVTAAGQLPDGREYKDAEEFKQLLLHDLDAFNATFIEKLATYGLRRSMTFSDRDELKKIAAASKAKDYRLRDVVEAFVGSDLFQRR